VAFSVGFNFLSQQHPFFPLKYKSKKMKKIIFILLPLFVIAILLSSKTLMADKESDKKVNLPKKVVLQNAEPVNFQEEIFAVGQLASSEEVKLSFKTGGIIKKIYVREGQKVRKGQLLAELQLDEINAQVQQSVLGVQQAEINIKNAQLLLNKAERDFRNVNGLYQDSVATLEQLEDAELQLNNAKNQLQAAETGLSFSQKNSDIAQFNQSHSRIIAPANGDILMRLSEANEIVGPGQPLFLFGSKAKAQVIRVNVPDKEIIHIELGAKASVAFDAYPDFVFQGKVRSMANRADPYTGTFEVEIEVDADGKKLLSGFIGQVHIKASQTQALIRIPIDALVSADKHKGFVFTVRNDTAIKTAVDIYRIEGKNLLLKNGLEKGSSVVVKGAGYLEDQTLVSVQ